MLKKWLLGLGTLGTLAAPVAAVVACGDDNTEDAFLDNNTIDLNKVNEEVWHELFDAHGRSLPEAGTKFILTLDTGEDFSAIWSVANDKDTVPYNYMDEYADGARDQAEMVSYLAKFLFQESPQTTGVTVQDVYDELTKDVGHHQFPPDRLSVGTVSTTPVGGSSLVTAVTRPPYTRPNAQTTNLRTKDLEELFGEELSHIDHDIYAWFGIESELSNPSTNDVYEGDAYIDHMISEINRRRANGYGNGNYNAISAVDYQEMLNTEIGVKTGATGEMVISYMATSPEFFAYVDEYITEESVLLAQSIRDEFHFEFDYSLGASQPQIPAPQNIDATSLDSHDNTVFINNYFTAIDSLIDHVETEFPENASGERIVTMTNSQYHWIEESVTNRQYPVAASSRWDAYHYAAITGADAIAVEQPTWLNGSDGLGAIPNPRPDTITVDVNPLIEELKGGMLGTAPTLDEMKTISDTDLDAAAKANKESVAFMYYNARQLVDFIERAGTTEFHKNEEALQWLVNGLGEWLAL